MTATDPAMPPVKEFIIESVAQCDKEKRLGYGWRPAGRVYETDYQRLQYLAEKGDTFQEFIDLLERIRKTRKLSKSALWERLVNKD